MHSLLFLDKKANRYITLKPLISSLLWNWHHENISFRSKVIPINYWKIPVPVLNPPNNFFYINHEIIGIF
jgi:hypothetical protein